MLPLTIPMVLRVMPRAGVAVVTAWIGALEQAMLAFDVYTPERAAMFLANLAVESDELTQLEENLNYRSADRLFAVFRSRFTDVAQAAAVLALGPKAIANHVYANREGNGNEASGDGWRYRGRANGLTFRNNYRAASLACCGDADTLLINPEFVGLPEFGAATACWHWNANGCNAFADAGDFDGVCDATALGHKTKAVGDAEGYARRVHYLGLAREAML